VSVTVDEDRATAAFKLARKELNKDVKAGLLEAAQDALPLARTRAAGFARPYLKAGSTSRNAYITTGGPRWVGRALGWLEFGGTVETELPAKDGVAYPVAPGEYRATVTGPRTIAAKRSITKVMQANVRKHERTIERHVTRRLKQQLD
jgi:hypothetical protein